MTVWYTLLIITMSGTPYMLPTPSHVYNGKECLLARDAMLKFSDGAIKAAICTPGGMAFAKEQADLAFATAPKLPK